MLTHWETAKLNRQVSTHRSTPIKYKYFLNSHGSESKHKAKPRLWRQANSPYIGSESIPLIRVVHNKTWTYCCDQWVVCCASDNNSAALPVNNLCSAYKYRVLACGRRKAIQSDPSRLLAAFLYCPNDDYAHYGHKQQLHRRSRLGQGQVRYLVWSWFRRSWSPRAGLVIRYCGCCGSARWEREAKSGTYQRCSDGAQIGCGSDRQLGSLVPLEWPCSNSESEVWRDLDMYADEEKNGCQTNSCSLGHTFQWRYHCYFLISYYKIV